MTKNFEGSEVPGEWRADVDATLELSTRHSKSGKQSLRWSWANGAPLSCDGLALSTAEHPQAGMQGWVYCEKPIDGRLTFRLGTKEQLSAGTPSYVFRFGLNFTGWRMFRVQFERDCRVAADGVEVLEIVPPEGVPTGCVYLDAITIAPNVSPQRSADFQVPEHVGGLGGWCEHWPLHYSRQTPTLPLPSSVTDVQKRDFATISERYFKWLLGDAALAEFASAQTQAYIRRGWDEWQAMGIFRDAEGRIIGPGLVKDFGLPTSFKHVFYDILMPLVFDWKLHGNETARQTVLEIFDYIHDQGWAEGSGLGDLWLNCLGFAPYCHAVVLMRDELRATGRLETAIRATSWYLTFGKSFSRFDAEYIETNADALRSIVFTSLAMILAMDDTPQKVQYMRGWQAWYHNALEISPRFTGLIKPDGLGFHHQGVYGGAYATCAYEFCSLIAWLLHGTEFAAASPILANLKQALITQDTISNKYDVPYTTMGRMPHPGVRILSAYAYLALASEPPDPELAGIFMRLWDPDQDCLRNILSFDLDAQGGKFLFLQTPGRLQIMKELADRRLPASPPPQGFWSKPWGALAMHRRDDWSVAVKGWSQYVWNFEMHPKVWGMREENVFARFWSYGTLQPITHGEPRNPVASGWNLDKGWDWCRWPGATTPHLALSEIYDPKTTWANRFFSAASFVGSVSCEGRNGMFALKLHEHYYDPTFRAFKTYFFFDNEIICLGSNIESRDDAHEMATTLFQSWMPEEGMPIQVDGQPVTAFPYDLRGEAGKPLTLMDPYGNGYFLPDGGEIRLTRGKQFSRDAWNKGATEGAFSTCWLDHGHGPREDGYGAVRYHYVQQIRTTPEALAALAVSPNYRVLQQNHQAHIVEHTTHKTMAYALFETDWIVPHGIVQRTDTPVMAMMKEVADGVVMSLADPDLRLPKRRNMGYLDDESNATPARPSVVRVELRGQWNLGKQAAGVRLLEARDTVTILEFTCAHGLTTDVVLEKI